MDHDDSDTTVQPAPKKRATKRGLTRTAATEPELPSDAPETGSHLTSVYSSCVQRSSVFPVPGLPRKPLFSKHANESTNTYLSDLPELSAATMSRKGTAETSTIFNHVEDENGFSPVKLADMRSPSPPSPPPPPVPVAARKRRMAKGIKTAFQALGSMKGALGMMTSPQPSSVVILDDSPVQPTQTIRVQHKSAIHRFSIIKTDIFYNIQQQMGVLLNVDPEQVGLFLNDHRLGGSDTPESVNLHLADIIECHILVPSGKPNVETDGVDKDSVRITMQCSNIRCNKQMVIKKYLPFNVLFDKYAKLQGKPVSSFKFRFDGDNLSPNMTPVDVDMDNDDTIDVVEIPQ